MYIVLHLLLVFFELKIILCFVCCRCRISIKLSEYVTNHKKNERKKKETDETNERMTENEKIPKKNGYFQCLLLCSFSFSTICVQKNDGRDETIKCTAFMSMY